MIASSTNLDTINVHNVNAPKEDISGRTFGRLLALSFYGRRGSRAFYRCQCSCGTVCIVEMSRLKNGHTSSCGCFHADTNREVHSIDITGQVFGRLTALSFAYRRNRQTLWNVKCSCGTEKVANYVHLVEGRTKSCGCIKREILSMRSGELNHLWRGGHPKIYPKEWNDNLKEEIRNRDSRKCQYPGCAHTDVGARQRLDVHHIDGNKKDCRSINLVSLCHSHHMKVEMSPRSWEEYFYSIVGDYGYR